MHPPEVHELHDVREVHVRLKVITEDDSGVITSREMGPGLRVAVAITGLMVETTTAGHTCGF
jgi:hypothetical protein